MAEQCLGSVRSEGKLFPLQVEWKWTAVTSIIRGNAAHPETLEFLEQRKNFWTSEKIRKRASKQRIIEITKEHETLHLHLFSESQIF